MEEDIEEVREAARERSLEEAVREGVRARRFTGEETLKQGMELIDFARRVNSRDGDD